MRIEIPGLRLLNSRQLLMDKTSSKIAHLELPLRRYQGARISLLDISAYSEDWLRLMAVDGSAMERVEIITLDHWLTGLYVNILRDVVDWILRSADIDP